jgi:hypothetical protein
MDIPTLFHSSKESSDSISNLAKDPGAAITAIAALGTSAYGLVDVLKSVWGGVSRIGYGSIEDALMPFEPALVNAIGPDWGNVIFSHWLNGVPLDDQKTKAKALIRLGLNQNTAAEIAHPQIQNLKRPHSVGPLRAILVLRIAIYFIRHFTRLIGLVDPREAPARALFYQSIDGEALATAAKKLEMGTDLQQTDLNVLGRFDATVDAALDSAYERADSEYRNAARTLAAFFSVILAICSGYFITGSWSQDFLPALLVGVVAVPLAPIAKDLSSALANAVSAMNTVKGKNS